MASVVWLTSRSSSSPSSVLYESGRVENSARVPTVCCSDTRGTEMAQAKVASPSATPATSPLTLVLTRSSGSTTPAALRCDESTESFTCSSALSLRAVVQRMRSAAVSPSLASISTALASCGSTRPTVASSRSTMASSEGASFALCRLTSYITLSASTRLCSDSSSRSFSLRSWATASALRTVIVRSLMSHGLVT